VRLRLTAPRARAAYEIDVHVVAALDGEARRGRRRRSQISERWTDRGRRRLRSSPVGPRARHRFAQVPLATMHARDAESAVEL